MARPRRRGDRVKHCNPCTSFAAVHESVGIERTQHRDAATAESDVVDGARSQQRGAIG